MSDLASRSKVPPSRVEAFERGSIALHHWEIKELVELFIKHGCLFRGNGKVVMAVKQPHMEDRVYSADIEDVRLATALPVANDDDEEEERKRKAAQGLPNAPFTPRAE